MIIKKGEILINSKKIALLSLVVGSLLFADGTQEVKTELPVSTKQLSVSSKQLSVSTKQLSVKQLEKQFYEVKSKLKVIPKVTAKIKELEEFVTKTLNRRKELEKIFLKLKTACKTQKNRDEKKGFSPERIKRLFTRCQKRVEATMGKDGAQHKKFLLDTVNFLKKINKQYIAEAKNLAEESNISEPEKKEMKSFLEKIEKSL